MPRKKSNQKSSNNSNVKDYRYKTSTRKNIPDEGLTAHGQIKEVPKIVYEYNPHLHPVLRFDSSGKDDNLPELLEIAKRRALNEEELNILADAIKKNEPWLEWSNKRERKSFGVDPVALHIHERISAQAILKILAREDAQRDLFADPQLEYSKAVKFYEYDIEWSNRIILGDSLQVMASLSKRENLAGQVQMIYMDPPYGIKFSSNFQNKIDERNVKEKEQDLTREPEMIKAYRDTWTLGIHSYLSYLRDRLNLCRELLKDSGSIFVQISDDNVHLVRNLLDEVFGKENFISQINFRTAMTKPTKGLNNVFDYLLWYSKDRKIYKYNPLYSERESTDTKSEHQLQASTKQTMYEFDYRETLYNPANGWRVQKVGLQRLANAERVYQAGFTENSIGTLKFIHFDSDFPYVQLDNTWNQQSSEQNKSYVVQTAEKIILRCVLMTSDPGDLILDPTCGSGTTAYVAEQYGRRWITIDTSRVAIALAKQRILTATYEHYKTKNGDGNNPSTGFIYETVSHITLKSIANNVALDSIVEKHKPLLDNALKELNKALEAITPTIRRKLKEKLINKQKEEGKKSIIEEDKREWNLPEKEWKEWEVPFSSAEEWTKELKNALSNYRKLWRAKMDEVNAAIEVNAEPEELVDKPEIDKKITRVSGPFTIESVIPMEETNEEENDLETFKTNDIVKDTINAETHISKIIHLLQIDGVRFPNNKILKFDFLHPVNTIFLHAEGEWTAENGEKQKVAVSVGPEHGDVTGYQVENAIRFSFQRGYDALVFAGFNFDASSQTIIQSDPDRKVRCHMAHIRPDILMGDLLKNTPSSQIFTVFGSPRTEITQNDEGEFIIEMQGVDIYDPVNNVNLATNADKVAAWFIDSDYDGKTFCITQAFFPDKTAWKKIAKALKGIIDEEQFEKLSGTVSLPFPIGKNKRAAVKVIDPRGNEVIKVHNLDAKY